MAIPPSHNSWLHRFAVLTAAITLLLLVAGGLVTSHGVGMAVPDWPNTYGYNMFLFPVSQWVGGIFFEHSHRLIAALVGLLTAILAVWLWARETRGWNRWLGVAGVVAVLALLGARKMPVYVLLAAVSVVVMVAAFWRFKNNSGALRWLGVVTLAAVILQGVLGGLRVVWLKDQIGVFHATLAQLFFALTCMIALFTSRWWINLPSPLTPLPSDRRGGQQLFALRKLRGLALATTLLILCQLIVGAAMRHQHAGLAIPDFPLAYGKLWPAMDADSVARYNQKRVEVVAANPITAFQIGLQMTHRFMAVAILIGVSAVAVRSRRRKEAEGSHVDKSSPPYIGGYNAILRRLAFVWLGLILTQVALGAWTIWSNKAADIATAHVLVGALSLVTGVLLCAISSRHSPLRTDLASSQIREMVSGGTVFENRDNGGCRQMT
jgi:cytochrome c oxidase assembly protein subunit 15